MTSSKIKTYGSWLEQIKIATSHFPEARPFHESLYQRSFEAFRAEQGRDPLPEDAILKVQQLSQEEAATHYAAIANRMEEDGFPLAYAHAVRRTHLMAVNDETRMTYAPEALAEWDAAVDEYGTFKRLSEEAERAGEHPAIVLALLRSGMRFPRGAQLLTDGPVVRFSLDTPFPSLNAAWAGAMREYQQENPDDQSIWDILKRAGSD
jgi:hypothetical protein